MGIFDRFFKLNPKKMFDKNDFAGLMELATKPNDPVVRRESRKLLETYLLFSFNIINYKVSFENQPNIDIIVSNCLEAAKANSIEPEKFIKNLKLNFLCHQKFKIPSRNLSHENGIP